MLLYYYIQIQDIGIPGELSTVFTDLISFDSQTRYHHFRKDIVSSFVNNFLLQEPRY